MAKNGHRSKPTQTAVVGNLVARMTRRLASSCASSRPGTRERTLHGLAATAAPTVVQARHDRHLLAHLLFGDETPLSHHRTLGS